MAQKRRDPKKEAFWRRQIRKQGCSGMTIRAWCLEQDVNEATFHWRRRELARRDDELKKADGTKRRNRDAVATPGFVPVRVCTEHHEICGGVTAENRDDDGGRETCDDDGGREACDDDGGREACDVDRGLDVDMGRGDDGSRDDSQAGKSQIEIALLDGRCIRVIGSVDRQSLADVLGVLSLTPSSEATIRAEAQFQRGARTC